MQNAISRQPLGERAEVHRREKPCPPHGPIMVRAVDEGPYAASEAYRASCLACGLEGPEREDGWEAKLAFDDAFRTFLREPKDGS